MGRGAGSEEEEAFLAAGVETEEGVGGTNSSHPLLRKVGRAVMMAAAAKAQEAVDGAADN